MRLITAALVALSAMPTSSASADTQKWVLPECVAGGGPVHLEIITETDAGWKVNGTKVQYPVPNPDAWVQLPPAQWIAPVNGLDAPAGAYTYIVPFSSPGPHGAMKVKATWSSDNCGTALQAGTGVPVGTGKCYNGLQDYFRVKNTTAVFSDTDSSNPKLTLTFVNTNQGGPTGLLGVFDITAQCP